MFCVGLSVMSTGILAAAAAAAALPAGPGKTGSAAPAGLPASRHTTQQFNLFKTIFLGTRGAVLHHSAETVLCFRNQVVLLSCLVLLSCCPIKVSELGKKTCLWCRTGPMCLPQSFLFVHRSSYKHFCSGGENCFLGQQLPTILGRLINIEE